jgi:hypothetical protein
VENNSTSQLLPRSPTRLARRGFDLGWSLLFTIGAVGTAFVSSLTFGVFAVFEGLLDIHQRLVAPMVLMLLNLAVFVGVGAYVLVLLPFLAKRSLRELGIRTFGWAEIGIGVVGAIAMTFVVDGLAVLMEAITHHHDTEGAIALLKELHTPAEAAIFIFMAAVLAPIVEELAFRAFLFNAFRRYAPVWVAALLSGILFGLAHAQSISQVLTVSIALAGGGTVLALVYSWSRCYWSNVITHALFNAFPLVLFFVFHVKAP